MWRVTVPLPATHESERGDIAAWVLVLLMSAGLVIAIWGIAEGRLVDIFSNALDTVCGGIGC